VRTSTQHPVRAPASSSTATAFPLTNEFISYWTLKSFSG
jgi:hypothetical protein